MPEIKNNFIRGRMNKDLDERLLPNGEYRDAMNIQVSTSEEDSVGTVQNVLGNISVGHTLPQLVCIGSIADEKNNHVYYFATTAISTIKNYIFRYKIDTGTHEIIFRDLNNIFKWRRDVVITGINIIDDMMFFTDDFNEPKKINIERSRVGTDQSDDTIHTKLVVNGNVLTQDVKESHVTVIKKGPNYSPELEMVSEIRDGNISGLIPSTNTQVKNDPTYTSATTFNFDQLDVGDTFTTIVDLTPDADGILFNLNANDIVVFSLYESNIPAIPLTDYLIKGKILNVNPLPSLNATEFQITIVTKSANVPVGLTVDNQLPTYAMSLFIEAQGMFEAKFPRFSIRYKYEDGEYSAFGPFSEIAFIPGDFDYEPKKGYNIGMTNKLKQLFLKEFVPNDIPSDVVSLDLLYKESDSTSVFVLASLKPDDPIITDAPYNGLNPWTYINSTEVITPLGPQTRSIKRGGFYEVKSETIYALVNEKQLIRPFDNVPRKALAQEVSGNRIIYGNYVQNYDVPNVTNRLVFTESNFDKLTTPGKPYKSIKSLREYQLGVVYLDEYGRQSPILTSGDATINVEKDSADKSTRLEARIKGAAPAWAKGFKFYVKETSGQFYNLAMDRFYDAEDGNIWLAFPSSDRNKVDIDTFLILKKSADKDFAITNLARYKILAIENNAPDYVKTVYRPLGQEIHNTAAPVNQDLFGTVPPFAGNNEFTIIPVNSGYAFRGSALFNIYELVKTKKIRVRFEDLNNEIESKSYIVSNIGYDIDTQSPLNAPQDDITIRIEGTFGVDTDFLTLDTTTNTHNTVVFDGIRIIFEEVVVENSPKFDGRFFVKIYNNETTRKEIGSNVTEDSIRYRKISSRKIYYMSPNFIDLHSFSSGAANPGTQDAYDLSPSGSLSTQSGLPGLVGTNNYHNQGVKFPGPGPGADGRDPQGRLFSDDITNWCKNSSFLRHYFYKFAAFFRDRTYYIAQNNRGLTASQSQFEDVWFIDGHSAMGYYDDTNGTVIGTDHTGGVAASNHNYGGTGAQPFNNGNGIDTIGTQGVIDLSFGGLEPDADHLYNGGSITFGDWGYASMTSNQFRYTQSRVDGSGGGAGNNKGQSTGWTQGPTNIYSVGNETENKLYGTEQEDFINNLAIGSKLRFKEDHNSPQNVYTIEDIDYYYIFRFDAPHTQNSNGSVTAGPDYGGVSPYSGTTFSTQGTVNHTLGNIFDYASNPANQLNNPGIGNGEPGFALRPENYQLKARLFLDKHVVWNPLDDTTLDVGQDPMNGYSPNSVEALAREGVTVTAQGYTLEIVEEDSLRGENIVSTNPAIWETEPKEQVELDIYHEASDKYPITLNEKNIFDILKIGSKLVDRDILNNGYSFEYQIDGFDGNNTIILNVPNPSGPQLDHFGQYTQANFVNGDVVVDITTEDGQVYGFTVTGQPDPNEITISTNMHNAAVKLNWFNCYSFGNGVESNRIEDNFNRVIIDNGPIVSTTVEDGIYKEERRKYGLIFSGLYNSTSGVNDLNQFIQAENITKEFNPTYGSLQKLFSRQSDLIALCEDKILKILANKDAVFNADGNPQLTANNNVLGQTIPFVGDYGISKNPESFAKESYRAYFTDKQRGAVLRLSMDGLTPISEAGMSDWFSDNLEPATYLLGSYDQDKSKYNLVINYGNYLGTRHINTGRKKVKYNLVNNDDTAYCLSFSERNKGWVTFNSFIYENAVSASNRYFTFKHGNIYEHHVDNVDRNSFYPTEFDYSALTFNILTGTSSVGVVTTNADYTRSKVKFIFNQQPNIIKEFRALNYEGSRSRLLDEYSDNSYKNLNDQKGWFASNISTNLEQGVVPYFVEKESKWFNYIKGNSISFLNNSKNIDASKFSVQGIGIVDTIVVQPPKPIYGCTDDGSDPNFTGRPTGFIGAADNYDPNANTDDGSCVWTVVQGCTDPNAINYDPLANVDNNSCILPVYGCTDGTGANNPYTPSTGPATNYDPAANVDDGSCVYTPPAPPPLQPAQILNAIDPSVTIDYVDGQGNVVGSNIGTALPLPNSGAGNLFHVNVSTAPSGEQTINFEYNFEFAPAYGGVPPYTYDFSMIKFYIDGPGTSPTVAESSSNAAGLPYTGSSFYIGSPDGFYGHDGTNTMNSLTPQPTGVPLGSHTPGQPGTTVTYSANVPSTFSSNGLNNFPIIGGADVEKIAVAFQVFTTDSAGTVVASIYDFPIPPGQVQSVASVTSPVYGVINTPLAPGAWTHSSTTNTFNSVSANVNFAAATGGSPPYTYSNLGYREVNTSTGGVIGGTSGSFNTIGSGNPYFSLSNYSWGPINWPSQGIGTPNEMYVEFTVDITDSAGTTITSTDIQTYNRPLFIGPRPFTGQTEYSSSGPQFHVDFWSMEFAVYNDINGNTVQLTPGSGPYNLNEATHFQNEAINAGTTLNMIGTLDMEVIYGNPATGGTPPYSYNFRLYYKKFNILANGNFYPYHQSGNSFPHGPFAQAITFDGTGTYSLHNFNGGISSNPVTNPTTGSTYDPSLITTGYNFVSSGTAGVGGVVVDTGFIHSNAFYGFHLYDSVGGSSGGIGGYANLSGGYVADEILLMTWMDTQETSTGNAANPESTDIEIALN